MARQVYNWTCSVCSYTWVIQATGTDPNLSREQAAEIIGYPKCVNENFGLMSADCMIEAFGKYGMVAIQKWVTFDEAYAICEKYTGVINPLGMYHFMAIRGVTERGIRVANSAPGYDSVFDDLDRGTFNALGPVQVIYVEQYAE
jgi:hypothetical protein